MRNPLHVRFVRHVALTGGAQAVQAALAMLAGILVARVLGAEGRGTLSVLVALGGMSVLLASLGVHLSGVYFLGRFKDDSEAVLSNNLLIGCIGGIVTALALAGIGTVFREQLLNDIGIGLFLLSVCAVPFTYFNEFGRSLLLGQGRIGAYNLPEFMMGGGVFLGTAAALLLIGHDLVPLVVLRVVVEAAIAVFVFLAIRKAVRFRLQPSRALLRRQLRYGLKNYASSLLWLLLLQSDLLLLNYFLGSEDTGIYSVAVSLGLPITMLCGVVGVLTFQRVSAEADRVTRVGQTNRAARVLLPIIGLGVLVIGLCAPWVVTLVYGREFEPAAMALILLLPGFLAYSLEMVFMNFLAGEGSPPIVVWAPLAGLVGNVAANLIVIPEFGINGASVTSSACYILVLLLVLRYYRRSTGSRLRDVLVVRRADLEAVFSGGRNAARPEAQAA